MMRVEDSLSMRPREVGNPGNGRPAREAGRVEEEEEDKPEADISTSVCAIVVAVLEGVGLLRGLEVVGIVALLWVWVSPLLCDGSIFLACFARTLPMPPMPATAAAATTLCGTDLCCSRAWGVGGRPLCCCEVVGEGKKRGRKKSQDTASTTNQTTSACFLLMNNEAGEKKQK